MIIISSLLLPVGLKLDEVKFSNMSDRLVAGHREVQRVSFFSLMHSLLMMTFRTFNVKGRGH